MALFLVKRYMHAIGSDHFSKVWPRLAISSKPLLSSCPSIAGKISGALPSGSSCVSGREAELLSYLLSTERSKSETDRFYLGPFCPLAYLETSISPFLEVKVRKNSLWHSYHHTDLDIRRDKVPEAWFFFTIENNCLLHLVSPSLKGITIVSAFIKYHKYLLYIDTIDIFRIKLWRFI